jgi:hypothetical protein
LAERVFLERGYELSGPRGEYIDHPMRRGIPGTSVRGKSTKQEIAEFLSGLNKPWGTWDFKSVCPIEFEDGQLKTDLFLAHLQSIEKSISRRMWLQDSLGIRV